MSSKEKKETIATLHLKEHFIMRNFVRFFPKYALLWMFAIAIGIGCSYLPWAQPVSDYSGMRAFAIAFITITTTTITFAIPTCMRTIFSAYEGYYSTKIKQILLQRFPVTLLALSAFTSLILSILIVSGILGIAVDVPHEVMFYISLFWTLVCVAYLFIAIEKMVYFTVNAPYAILDKLEYGVMSHREITTEREYERFRDELSSINDIAATIVSRSTGQDKAVTTAMKSMFKIHRYYLTSATAGGKAQLRYHLMACQAVDHEMVRLFRASAQSCNEQACGTVIRTYCAMLSDAFKTKTGVGYFSDMMEEIPRIQSYANAAYIDDIEVMAYVGWFYTLAKTLDVEEYDKAKLAIVVRILSESLRRAVIDENDRIIYSFMRAASNTTVSHDVDGLSGTWLNILDRTVFVFVTWLIDAMPENSEKYLDYIRRYSMFNNGKYRSVLPDTRERVEALIAYESLASLNNDDVCDDTARFFVSSDHMALAMSISLEDTAAHTLSMLALMQHAGLDLQEVATFGRAGEKLVEDVEALDSRKTDKNFEQRLVYTRELVPGTWE